MSRAGSLKRIESVCNPSSFGCSEVLVTGGAGFIGSHLVERLIEGDFSVTVFDNLSGGRLKNIERLLETPHFKFLKGDLKNLCDVEKAVDGVELIFHLAANPEVRVGETDPTMHFNENLVATFNLLEALRTSDSAKTLVLASTSTVYGEATKLPTPEDYGLLIPVSTYGASKLSCEALASSYAHTFDLRVLILRLANIVGSRASHGVIIDFIEKLRKNPSRLEILGDGNQRKSYLYIEDCIDAIVCATNEFLKSGVRVDVYNVGSADQVDVKRIAEIVAEQMNIKRVDFVFTGGVDGGRGWLGDVKNMHLSIGKLLGTGWELRHSSEEAVRLAARAVLRERRNTHCVY